MRPDDCRLDKAAKPTACAAEAAAQEAPLAADQHLVEIRLQQRRPRHHRPLNIAALHPGRQLRPVLGSPPLHLPETDLQLCLLRQVVAVGVNSVRGHVGRAMGAHTDVLSEGGRLDPQIVPLGQNLNLVDADLAEVGAPARPPNLAPDRG